MSKALRRRGGNGSAGAEDEDGWVQVRREDAAPNGDAPAGGGGGGGDGGGDGGGIQISEGLRETLAQGYSTRDLSAARARLLEKRVAEETAEAMERQRASDQAQVETMLTGCGIIVVVLALVYLVFRFGPVLLAANRGGQPGVHPELTQAMAEMREVLGPVANLFRL
jgi:hypothetical protein